MNIIKYPSKVALNPPFSKFLDNVTVANCDGISQMSLFRYRFKGVSRFATPFLSS